MESIVLESTNNLDQIEKYETDIDNSLTHATIAVCDLDGVLRGKKIIKDKLIAGLNKGIGFSDVILGWDIQDTLYTEGAISNWETGYGDIPVLIDMESKKINPLDNNSQFYFGDMKGRLQEVCPRSLLKRIKNYAKDNGYLANVSCEYEFVLLDETSFSVREKNYKNLRPISTSVQAYSVLETNNLQSLFRDIISSCNVMELPIEGIHPETGEGVYESALLHTDPIRAADNALLFKMIVKLIAQKHHKLATFIPKIMNDKAGQGGHIHISLNDTKGHSIFYDEDAQLNISAKMKHFIGGIQKLTPEILCMTVPTINGFKRLVPGSWAPTNNEWGIENRTCGIRVIGKDSRSMHIEYRISGSDINPYIAISAILGAGIWGINNRIEPKSPVTGNAYLLEHTLPTNLDETAKMLKCSQIARELFGNEFVEHYAYSREWEAKQYAKSVTNWELERYLETI